MAAFSDDEIDDCINIWNLFQNGAVTLFRDRDRWTQILSDLRSHAYRTVIVDCSSCADESALLFSIVDALDIPRFPDINLDGFNDFMSQIDFAADTGVAVCLDKYDVFYTQFPSTARSILDILADTHRHEMLVGNRLTTVVQSDDPSIDRSIGVIGGFTPQWNTAEWMNRDRGL